VIAWILILYASSGPVVLPVSFPSRNACELAAASVKKQVAGDIQLRQRWSGEVHSCIGVEVSR
jgi:hypothetical protein